MALDFEVLAELKKLEMELNEVQNNLTQALSQTPEISRSLQLTRATTDSSIQPNLVAPEDNENASTIEANSSEGINRDDMRSREDIGVSVSSTLENSSRIHKKPSYPSSSPYGISPSIGESESLHTQAFMVRVSSPLKQSYIPEPILESDEEDTVDDVGNLSIQNNNASPLDTLAEEKEITSEEEEGSEDSEPISLEPSLNEQRSIDQQPQTGTLVSEPESMKDNNQEMHKAENTGRRESLLDPVHRLKELLVSQPHQAEYSDIEPLNLLQPKAGEISTIESVDNAEKEKDTNEQFLLKHAHIDSLSSVIDNISTATTSKSEFSPSAKPPDDPVSLLKSVDDSASISEPEPADDSSLLEETREVSSVTSELLDDESSLQKTRDISNAESVDDSSFHRFRDISSSTTESVDDSSMNKSEADFYWMQDSTDAYAPQKLIIKDPSLIRRENSSSSESEFELNRNRPLPESFDSDDLREIKDRVKRKNSYVSKRKMLEQEETGLTFWLNLNAKKEPPKAINNYKPKRNPITETAFKSTPPSTPTAKTYSSSPLATVSPLSQPTQKTSRASLDMYSSSLNSTPSLTNSTKSSKSSKSSRASLDIQVSSLYNRHLSPPSSPKPKASSFLSLPGLSRRTSFNKVTRPSFISPPIISSPITSSSPMNQPAANASSSSLSSPPMSPPPPSTPKRQRRFSFQAVTSRFSFSQPSNNQTKASLDAPIVETDDDSSGDEFDPMAEVDENALNKLCDVLPHANRDLLAKYLQRAGGKDDLLAVGLYMKDLKSGEINGT